MKYIIEIPDGVPYVLLRREDFGITKVVPVADLEELDSDYINEHYGELQDEAYQRGINDGSLDVKQRVEGAYQKGLEDAWEAARRIVVDTDHGGLALGTLSEIFGTQSCSYIMRENTAQEAIDKIKAYEDKRSDRIEVGDEVNWDGVCFIVTKIFQPRNMKEQCDGIDDDGSVYHDILMEDLKKTGKHYDIASILEAMRE